MRAARLAMILFTTALTLTGCTGGYEWVPAATIITSLLAR